MSSRAILIKKKDARFVGRNRGASSMRKDNRNGHPINAASASFPSSRMESFLFPFFTRVHNL